MPAAYVPSGPALPHTIQPKKSKKAAEIEAHLQRLHETTISAIDERNFDPESEAWQHYADKIEVDVDVPELGARARARARAKQYTLVEHLEGLKGYMAGFSETPHKLA